MQCHLLSPSAVRLLELGGHRLQCMNYLCNFAEIDGEGKTEIDSRREEQNIRQDVHIAVPEKRMATHAVLT
jgi:hypothetical protein